VSRGHYYRVGASTPEAESSSGLGGGVLIGIGIGLGWLVHREVARERRDARKVPDVSDIEALIRVRGINPYSYGLSGHGVSGQPRKPPRKKG